jgi:transposase
MKKCINKLLNLQGLLVDKLEVLDEEKLALISCRNPRLRVKCPLCEKSISKVHSYKTRKINHGILNYRKIVLVLKTRRFKCSNRFCRHVFTEQFPGISRKRSSVNMMMQIIDWLRRNSFNFVSQ